MCVNIYLSTFFANIAVYYWKVVIFCWKVSFQEPKFV